MLPQPSACRKKEKRKKKKATIMNASCEEKCKGIEGRCFGQNHLGSVNHRSSGSSKTGTDHFCIILCQIRRLLLPAFCYHLLSKGYR
ncbi:hypothetical protein Q9966_011930 [Columba livia]|nr:hypothetical protein Q9966_011930 [Columba livia]